MTEHRKMRIVAFLRPTGYPGQTLGDWLIDNSGPVGAIVDPFGESHQVTVAALADRDPGLFLDFRFEEETQIDGVGWDALNPDEAQLKEWDLVGHPAKRCISDYVAMYPPEERS
ncbi:hypothetical protein GII33_22720 (plasmid) [Gordonia pseudamarae]|jgi:hypothetical protein|uniref:hypothetical protein n=1 Tax=Gordonia pseudamarae TaxID=2831662 RepID=UPI001AF58766|nr:hypothetical protein [Gordonia pseudamarae]QHN28909.1 hypothetical protein GII33_22720 [Gordonia pseudamarae]HMT33645.1 hypothetical protein [Dermatophilaceae bacterium]